MKKVTFYIFLFLLISYGVFLRFYELSTGSFWIDEGYSSIISYLLIENNYIPKLLDGSYAFGQYFFHFFQSIIFQLFGISDFFARIPSIIFGILNIILFYFFAQILLKNTKYKNIGLIFMMFLFLFSTWQIIWSREARFYEMLSFLYLLSSFLFYKFIKFEKNIYLFGFLLSLLIGLVFHQFFLAFLCISGIFFIKYSIQQKKYIPIFGLIFTIVLYLIIQFIIKSYNVTNLEFLNIIPTLNSISDYNFFTYFSFYIKVFFEQLGIIFVFYILGILYFIFSKKYSEFLIFGGVFIINIVAISFGYFAHSRYMFHLFSIITLIGGYIFILFLDNLFSDNNKYKKILAFILIIFGGFGIFKTYNFTFLPQRFYYIDETSPKPNFKNAYLYLKNNMKMDEKIVSGFPHMCFWYNLKNTKKCEFALSINLIGNSIFDEKILQKKSENYTNTKYLDDLSKIDGKKYYFVLDDLTIKNSVNKILINEVLDKCYIVYKDVGNYDSSSFIGIWKCY